MNIHLKSFEFKNIYSKI